MKAGEPFTWGEAVRFYEVGAYTILEFYSWKVDDGVIRTGEPSDQVMYHTWIDGEDSCRGASSIEEAISDAIAYKHDGPNSQAGRFFHAYGRS